MRRAAARPAPTHIPGALRESVRPEPVEGPLHHHQGPRVPHGAGPSFPHYSQRHSCEGRNPEGRGAATRHSTCKRPRSPPTVVLAKAGTQGRCAARRASVSRTSHVPQSLYLRRQESRGAPGVRHARHKTCKRPRSPQPSFPRKREPRAGARRGAASVSNRLEMPALHPDTAP